MADRPLEVRYKSKKFRIEELGARIAELPRLIRRPALRVISDFMLKRFKLYPRYKYKSRAGAYGYTGATFENGKPVPPGYFSAKQFRYVMAKIADGTIQPGSPHRTMDLKNAWRVDESNRLDAMALVNDDPAAVFAYSPDYQARQLEQVGWQNTDIMAEENLPDAMLELEVWIFNNVDEYFDKAMTK